MATGVNMGCGQERLLTVKWQHSKPSVGAYMSKQRYKGLKGWYQELIGDRFDDAASQAEATVSDQLSRTPPMVSPGCFFFFQPFISMRY